MAGLGRRRCGACWSTSSPSSSQPLPRRSLWSPWAGVLRARLGDAVQVDYFDEQLEPLSALAAVLARGHHEVVGVSVQVGAAASMWEALSLLRSVGGKRTVCVGNVTATYAADRILADFPEVVVCVGRGEETLVELVQRQLDHRPRSYEGVPNLVWDASGRLVRNEQRHLAAQFECPADWDGFFGIYPADRYREFWLESSRGCPQKRNDVGCTYCAILPDAGSRDWAPRSMDTVRADITSMVGHGVPHVRFADEEFMANQPHRALEFASVVEPLFDTGDGHRVTFDVAMRVDDVVRPNPSHDRKLLPVAGLSEAVSSNELRRLALAALRRAGLRQVYLGVESGDPAQLKRMRKGVTVEGNARAIAILREEGIRIACGWIMFDPFMTDPTELLNNAGFLWRNRLLPTSEHDDFVTNPVNRMRALEGAPLVQQLKASGLLGATKPNLVEYDVEYACGGIQSVDQALAEWQQRTSGAVGYALKSKVSQLSLGQATEAEATAVAASSFFALKELDLLACESLARALLSRGDRGAVTVADIPEELTARRDVAVAATLQWSRDSLSDRSTGG